MLQESLDHKILTRSQRNGIHDSEKRQKMSTNKLDYTLARAHVHIDFWVIATFYFPTHTSIARTTFVCPFTLATSSGV